MKGILFTEPMFLAATRDKDPKTQTRRIEKSLSLINQNPSDWVIEPYFDYCFFARSKGGESMCKITPRYQKGETIFLKEPFLVESFHFRFEWATIDCRYGGVHRRMINISEETAYALSQWKSIGKWTSPLLMFADFARYHATITNVRCERLQDISKNDAIAEGIECIGQLNGVNVWKNYNNPSDDGTVLPVISYWSLWEKIHSKESWEQNPYVFVYEFTVKPV